VCCEKMAEPIELPFGMMSRVGSRIHVPDASAHWRHLVNATEPSVCSDEVVICMSNYYDHLLTLLYLSHSSTYTADSTCEGDH